jgi:2-oxoglutarate dehydrogenase E1 component
MVYGDEKVVADGVRKVLLCSGMVYEYLSEYRDTNGMNDVAIIRIEQLAPFPFMDVAMELVKYPSSASVNFVQEDPQNYGAWHHVAARYPTVLKAAESIDPPVNRPASGIMYIGRPASAAQATGFCSLALTERDQLLEDAFA